MMDILSELRATRASWHSLASCRQTDTPDLWYSPYRSDRQQAIQICEECPVRAPCERQALSLGDRWGIWGGIKQEERRRELRRARAQGHGQVPAHVRAVDPRGSYC